MTWPFQPVLPTAATTSGVDRVKVDDASIEADEAASRALQQIRRDDASVGVDELAGLSRQQVRPWSEELALDEAKGLTRERIRILAASAEVSEAFAPAREQVRLPLEELASDEAVGRARERVNWFNAAVSLATTLAWKISAAGGGAGFGAWYGPPGYFAPTYFNAVWHAGAIGPKVIALADEAVWLAEASARFLGLSRSSGEAVRADELTARLRVLARVTSLILDLGEALDAVVIRLGQDLVRAVSAEIWTSDAVLRARIRVTKALEAVYIDELTNIFPALGRKLIMVMTRAVQATETKLRLRARIKRVARAIQVSELALYPGIIIRGLVHSGIKLRALIAAAFRVNKR